MALTSSNQHVVADVVTRNEAGHLLIAQLATDVAHDPAPVLHMSSVAFEVKGAGHLRHPHLKDGVDAVEEELHHQVAPAILIHRLLPILEHPQILVLRDQVPELVGALEDLGPERRRPSLEAMLIREKSHLATAHTVPALVGPIDDAIWEEHHHLVHLRWLKEIIIL